MADERLSEAPEPRAFWSGTITFGLVSIPIDLYPAVRSQRPSLRMLDAEGRPLRRRYYCHKDGRALGGDDLIRGYEAADGRFVTVTQEELRALAPRQSRDIDLRRFVSREEVDPLLLERPYILAPAGQSTKAYHLLTRTMERTGRAGIATFVMRGKEYLTAILAEDGLLQAVTLRFADELRTPEELGLPEAPSVPDARVEQVEQAVRSLEREELDLSRLRDTESQALLELAERKRAAGRDVIEVPEEAPGLAAVEAEAADEEGEEPNVVDIMQLLRQRLGGVPAGEPQEPPTPTREAARRGTAKRGAAKRSASKREARERVAPGRLGRTKGRRSRGGEARATQRAAAKQRSH